MSDSVLCDAGALGGSADLQWVFGSPLSVPVYVTFEMYLTAANLAAWFAAWGDYMRIGIAHDTGGNQNKLYLRDSTGGGAYDGYTDDNIDSLGSPLVGGIGDGWHTITFCLVPDGGTDLIKVDALTDSVVLPGGWGGTSLDFFNVGIVTAVGVGDCYLGRISVGGTVGAHDLFDYLPCRDGDPIAFGFNFDGTVSLATAPTPPPSFADCGTPPPPPGPSRRFFSGYPWRFIVTDLNTETITFLDRLSTARQVSVGRNVARTAQGTVPSDNPEINILHTDGDPFLNEGNRLVYGFRREGWNGSVGPWVCRFAGPLLHLEDNAQTDAPASPWIAMDPWAKLYRVPVRLENGDLPGPDGRVFLAADLWTYPEIAFQLLLDSITYDGTCFIDTAGGTIVPGPVIGADFTLQQGLSVGAAWDQLCATGKVDIELDPVYDPVGSPGICCTFNAKPVIGVTQNAAIFAWDLPSRSLTDISRVIDGTGRANTIQYYFGQGGPPVSLQVDAASVAKDGEYWEQQFWPGFKEAGPVTAMAARRLALVKDGVRTFTFAPAPERSPIPFDDYMPGDWAPFFASKKLRAVLQPALVSGQWTNIPRIESFTVDIADNQTETVNPLLVSMDIQP
jgi:hypothetical protein